MVQFSSPQSVRMVRACKSARKNVSSSGVPARLVSKVLHTSRWLKSMTEEQYRYKRARVSKTLPWTLSLALDASSSSHWQRRETCKFDESSRTSPPACAQSGARPAKCLGIENRGGERTCRRYGYAGDFASTPLLCTRGVIL